MLPHLTRLSRHLLFWSLLAIALSLTGLRMVLSGVERYKADLAVHVSELLHAPVSIGHLRAKMRGFNPELILADIQVQAQNPADQPAMVLREIRLGVDVLDTLINRDVLSSAWVTLVGAKFSVYRKVDGSFAVMGLQGDGEQPDWLWQGRKFELLDSDIVWEQPDKKRHISLPRLDIAIINHEQEHRIQVLAKLPQQPAARVSAAMVFTGNPFINKGLNGKIYIASHQFPLNTPLINDWSKNHGITLNSGKMDMQLWLSIQESQLNQLTGDVLTNQATLSQQHHAHLTLHYLKTAFSASLDNHSQQWQVTVPKFVFQSQTDTPASTASLQATGNKNQNDGLQTLALASQHADLQQLSQATAFFAPLLGQTPLPILNINPQGSVDKLRLFLNLQNHTGAIQAEVKHLQTSPFNTLPGISNLSVHVHGNQQQGVLDFNTQSAQIVAPSLFRVPVAIAQLHGKLGWRQLTDVWELSSKALQVDLTHIETLSQLQLKLAKTEGLPFLDLQTALRCDDVRSLKNYFPVGVMKPADTEWLDKAFLQGKIHNGKLVFIGPLGQNLANHVRDFDSTEPTKIARQSVALAPIDNPTVLTVDHRETVGGGFFEAMMDVENAELDYAPSWPIINNINGQLRFLQGRMIATADTGHSLGLVASKVNVINPAVGVSPILLVQGQVDGEISHVLAFLKQTPLRERIGLVADAIRTQGKTQVSLDLQIPLAVNVLPKVAGKATLNQASLNVLAIDLPVSRITGLLKFNENGIYSDTIHANALKNPITIKIANEKGQTTLHANGAVTLHTLEQQFKLPHLDFASGELPYQLAFRLPLDDQPTELIVASDLTGLKLTLPGLLTKSVNETQALKVVFGLGNQSTMPIQIDYGQQLQAALQFDTASRQMNAGDIVFGGGTAKLPTAMGIYLKINRPTLNLQDAFTWVAAGGQGNGNGALREIHLHTDNALWAKTSLGQLDLALKPDNQQWLGHLDSNFASGDIRTETSATAENTITLALSKLNLSQLKQALDEQRNTSSNTITPASQSADLLSPQSLPLLALHSDKTLWKNLDLGELTFNTERLPDGIAIKTLTIKGSSQKLDVLGHWTDTPLHQQSTELHGTLSMPKAGELLAQLELGHDLVETSATVAFSAHWPGGPQQFSLGSLQGDVNVDFTEGRILSIDPGFGRILGVLAVEQWLKRLQLDFRDLYQEGLAFNSIKGHFTIADGKALTKDLRVDAIPARISISGNTDFINKTLDQQASVIPKSADALPIAGTIVDKFAALVAHTLTGDEQEGFLLGSRYQLKGAWDSVQVIPLHEQSGVVPKLWGELTNFTGLDNDIKKP